MIGINDLLAGSYERMVDQLGRPLTWRGRWQLAEPTITLPDTPPVLPATFPRYYYKVGRRVVTRAM